MTDSVSEESDARETAAETPVAPVSSHGSSLHRVIRRVIIDLNRIDELAKKRPGLVTADRHATVIGLRSHLLSMADMISQFSEPAAGAALSAVNTFAQAAHQTATRIAALPADAAPGSGDGLIRKTLEPAATQLAPMMAWAAWSRIEGIDALSLLTKARTRIDEIADAGDARIRSQETQLAAIMASAAAAVTRSSNLLKQAENVATAAVIARHHQTFVAASSRHAKAARYWLAAAALTMIVAVVLLSYFLTAEVWHWPGALPTSSLPGLVAAVVTRIALLTTLGTAGFWAARNYAVHRHNDIVNVHRTNALATFSTLADAAPNEAARTAILAAVTQCLFSAQPTTPNVKATDPSVAGLAELATALARAKS